MTSRPITVLLCLALAGVAGCGRGSTAQGTLYSVTISQELEAYLPHALDSVYEAAGRAVTEMGYTVDTQAVDVREGRVEGRTAMDRPVRIRLYRQGEGVTRIRVSAGGDRAAGRDLLDRIEASLDAGAA